MAVTALHSAATGLGALSREIDIIANNLANVNTTGFKGLRANFEDLLYEAKEQPGVENGQGNVTPAGLFVGLGTKISNTQFDFAQGDPVRTDGDFDVMINGRGFFQVQVADDLGGGTAYTRAGNFFVNREGQLVLGNSFGPLVTNPNIDIDPEAIDIAISEDGRISGLVPPDTERTEFGQLQIATFVNPSGLTAVGGNLLIESEGSGPPIVGNPNEANRGRVLHKFLEASNVDPVKELVSLIKTQRAFELNSQTIQTADQTLQVISNLRR
ncbi:MAG: flagellar basal-body rod protein FlgG [Phycisphaeraceae bacterium]